MTYKQFHVTSVEHGIPPTHKHVIRCRGGGETPVDLRSDVVDISTLDPCRRIAVNCGVGFETGCIAAAVFTVIVFPDSERCNAEITFGIGCFYSAIAGFYHFVHVIATPIVERHFTAVCGIGHTVVKVCELAAFIDGIWIEVIVENYAFDLVIRRDLRNTVCDKLAYLGISAVEIETSVGVWDDIIGIFTCRMTFCKSCYIMPWCTLRADCDTKRINPCVNVNILFPCDFDKISKRIETVRKSFSLCSRKILRGGENIRFIKRIGRGTNLEIYRVQISFKTGFNDVIKLRAKFSL